MINMMGKKTKRVFRGALKLLAKIHRFEKELNKR